MRTTLDIPQSLLTEALRITKSRTKTDLIKMALKNIIQKNRIQALKEYQGKVDLTLDLDVLRKRK